MKEALAKKQEENDKLTSRLNEYKDKRKSDKKRLEKLNDAIEELQSHFRHTEVLKDHRDWKSQQNDHVSLIEKLQEQVKNNEEKNKEAMQ